MGISICVCTRNRDDSLKRALESLTRLDHPSGIDWDVLVVDNGSTDATADTAMSFADQLTLKVVSETKAGLSQARNTALRVARGRHLIFIDDDVTVPPKWLTAYATGFAKHPDAGFFGGPIVARTGNAPQEWVSALREVMPGALSWLEPELGEHVLASESACLPWGANMAIRKSSLDGKTFDIGLGRRPDSPIGSSEEMSFFNALLESGVTGVWLPETGVDHHVGMERCCEAYLRDYCRGVGQYEGRRKAAQGDNVRWWVFWWAKRTLRRWRQRYSRMNSSMPVVPRLTALGDYIERCSATQMRECSRGVGRYKGGRKAAQGGIIRRSVLWWARRTLRRRRERYLTMNSSAPLVPRLTVLRDYSILEGFHEGFAAVLDEQEGSDQAWE